MSLILNSYRYAAAMMAVDLPVTSGLAMYLTADAITGKVDGDTLTSWADISGNSRNGTAVGTPSYRTAVVNGLPIVRFNGTSDYFTLPNTFTSLTEGEGFIVVKLTTDTPPLASAGLWNFGSSGSQAAIFTYDGDNHIYDDFASTTRRDVGDPPLSLNVWRLYNVSSKAGEWTARHDTVQRFTTATNTVGWKAGPRLGGTPVGATIYLKGDVACCIVYGSVLSAGDRTSTEQFLKTKYGLSYA